MQHYCCLVAIDLNIDRLKRRPGAPAVIGLTRLYCHNRNDFRLVDVDTPEAAEAADKLREDGWEIEAEIPV